MADIDVNSWDERLQSLLWYAAKNRHLEIIQLFLAQVAVGVDAMVDQLNVDPCSGIPPKMSN
jgi:hypothetical protein